MRKKKGFNDIAFTVAKDEQEEALEIIKQFKEEIGAKDVIMKVDWQGWAL